VRSSDLKLRLDVMAGTERPRSGEGAEVDRGALARARDAAKQYRRRFRCGDAPADTRHAAVLVALAYPDRIAQRRPGGERGAFKLANGRGARLDPADPLAGADYLAVSDLASSDHRGTEQEARIFVAEPLALPAIEAAFAEAIVTVDVVRWDAREEAVVARRERRLFALVLGEEPAAPDEAPLRAAMLEGIRIMGLAALPWTPAIDSFRARVAFLRGHEPDWPDLSDATLLATLADWLGPFLGGVTRRAHLGRVDLAAALGALLPHALRRRLDEAAPTHVAVPSGSRIAIDYGGPAGGSEPVLAARLQEMFGLGASPRIAGGKVPLLIHLLSPAGRPVQVTRDLASFWRNGYREVRAELRARYPRHYWPEDPLSAVATRRVRPR
jgi:ATP-dependent helicase HrpB